MHKPSSLLPLCALAGCALAQPLNLPIIRDINYEGLLYISPAVANEIANIKIGAPLDLERVNRSIIDFHRQGYFQDIWVSEDDGILTFHFKEKPSIAAIEIEGYGIGTDKDAIAKEIGIKKGDVFDTSRLENVKKKIYGILEAKGYYDTVIETQTEEINERAIKLTILVNQGEEITITKVHFHGAENLSTSKIESVMLNREEDWLGWMWGFNDGKLHASELENDSRRVRDYYMRKGYLDAHVSPPLLSANFDSYTAEMSLDIIEGNVYMVRDVSIDMDTAVIETEELYDLLMLVPDKRFNIETVRKDIERMKDKIGDLGYAFVRIDPQFDSDKDDATVSISYKITTGNQARIGDVIISGNTRTLDRVIRREIALSPGDLYQTSRIKISRNSLRQLGFFDKVEIDERRVDEETVDLLVSVSETHTGEVLFGIGYGSYDGILGNISLRERNVFGSGMTGGIYLDKSRRELSYRVDLYNPRIFDSRYSLATEAYRREYTTYDYTENSTGVGVTFGRRFFDFVHATLGYSYVQTELTDFVNNLAEIYRPYFRDGLYSKSSIIPGLSYDSTDDYYFPRNGIALAGFVEFAGVGGDEQFIKYYTRGAAYTNLDFLDDWDVIFRLKGRAGVISETGYLPINEKFYLGGMSTLRGYRSSSITPFDPNGVRIGGKYTASGSLEASLGLFETVQMRLTGFFDFGTIGQDGFGEINRYSTGLGIEWVSPLGPINFIFPYALNYKPGDKTSRFEFNMGTRF